MKKFLMLFMLLSVLFTSCWFASGERVRGNGNVITQERTVSEFAGVRSSGFFDVYVTNGPVSAVKIEAEENIQQYIETETEGGVLKIGTTDGYNLNPRYDVKIYITAPSFNQVRLFGSGDIIGQNTITDPEKMELGIDGSGDIKITVDVPSVETGISGSGTVNISGVTKNFHGEINGSGDIRAMDLKAEEATIDITGSGNANVFASMKLNVDVNGSGDVKYKGGATVSSNIRGSGSVVKLD